MCIITHCFRLLQHIPSVSITMQKIVTFGEVMMRLSPPGFRKFEQATQFDVHFGGTEANVGLSLSYFGIPAAHVTRFPDNAIGQSALQFLRKHGVDASHISLGGDRLGLYFLETGAVSRASKIVYDRYHSAFAEIPENCFDWETILKDARWFHWSGVTPALSQNCANECLKAIQVANRMGIPVSGDVYYRSNLWRYGTAPQEILPGLVAGSNLILANAGNMEDLFGIPQKTGIADNEIFVDSCRKMTEKYPSIQKIVDTDRVSVSASHNRISAMLWNGTDFVQTDFQDITHIVDRIGGGDAFLAGLIYGLLTYQNDQQALDFGICASALKHTVEGDVNLVSVAEVETLMQGDASGRLRR